MLKPTTKVTSRILLTTQHMAVTGCPPTRQRETKRWCCNCTSLSFTFQNIGVSFKICHSFQPRSAGHRAGYQKTNSCSLPERSCSSAHCRSAAHGAGVQPVKIWLKSAKELNVGALEGLAYTHKNQMQFYININ